MVFLLYDRFKVVLQVKFGLLITIERKYIRYSGRYIIPTRKGLFIYETIRGTGIADAALTTGWEARLARMERGKLTQNVFLREVADLAQKVTDEIFQACKPRK